VSKTLILFATTHGHTACIAQRIAAILRESGDVDVVELRRFGRSPSLAGYDQAVLAGSVHFGRHQRRLERFIHANREALSSIDSAFVSVSGSAIDEDGRPDAEEYVADMARRTGWQPRRVLLAGGATSYTRYGFFLKRTVRKASAASGRGTDITRDYDYTDWAAVEEFAKAPVCAFRICHNR
jgi:menaquinone-dependent protoporphyrinogen oxidase